MIEVQSARDLGPQLVENKHRMVGQDGAYSIPLSTGEVFFFFGDTLIGRRPEGRSVWYPDGNPVGPADMSGKFGIEKMLNNTGLILRQDTLKQGFLDYEYICDSNGDIRILIPHLPDEHHDEYRIWCMHGLQLGERLYLACIKVHMLPDGPFPVNFEIVGSGLAVGSPSDFKFRRVRNADHGLFWKVPEPPFGTTMLHDEKSGWVYCYGVRMNDAGVQQCYVSRVRPDSIENLESYEYLIGEGPEWSGEIGKAIPIMEEMPNEMSVSWNAHLSSWLAVHSLNISGKIVGRTAPDPWGPWSEPTVLWEAKAERKAPLPYPPLIYAGKEHAALSDEDGRTIYLTYIEFEEYFPHLIEATLR